MNPSRFVFWMCLLIAPAMAQQPPAFVLQPQSQSPSVGGTASLRSTVSGTLPMAYQWFHNTQSLSGATNSTLMLTNVQLTHSGEYQVQASNDWGTVLSTAALLDVDPTFTQITVGRIVTDGGDSTGVAWGDYDGDGFLDLFVSNFGTPFNFLYRNNGDETFTRVDSGIVTREDMNAEGCAWADYDNNGHLDLFVAVGLGANDALYSNDGAGGFTKITNGPPVRSGGSSRGCAWADYDNDGWLDLFVANEQSQSNFLFHNDGPSGFTRITAAAIVTNRGNSFGCSWADYDNDGYPDLFVANNGSQNFLYHNQRDGTFARIVSSAVVTNVAGSASGSWGDYDNDGNLDLFVANLGQRNFLYHNQGDGTFLRITNGPIVETVGYSWGGAWADFDNDGWLDLFVANGQPNGTGARDYLFKNAGDGAFTRVERGSLISDNAAGDGCAWGDYNNDGFPDLFVSNINGQNNRLYRNNGNSNHWLAVQCEGRFSNASAIGARLELIADIGGKPVRQIREISGGGGYGSQNGLRAHFGLGPTTSITSLRLRWPSGIVQELTRVPVDQMLTVREPPQLLSVPQQQDGIFRGEFRGGRNRIYELQATENLMDWTLLTTLTNRDGISAFTDVMGPNGAVRFYRVQER